MTLSGKLLLIGLFYNIGWIFITSGVNVGVQDAIDVLVEPLPDVADYSSVFGTAYLDYFMDWVGAIGAKTGAFFTLVISLFISPELEMYGQTADMTLLAPINIMMLGFVAYGLYGALATLIGGIL